MRIRLFPGVVIFLSTSILVACASSSLKPEDYGFRRVAIGGQEYLCAPPEVVVPPYVPLAWPIARLPLPSTDVAGGGYPRTREVCLTQAQWPDWLVLRTRNERQWPITPSASQALASR
jgi:hypothetical protein